MVSLLKNIVFVSVPAIVALALVMELMFRTIVPSSNPPQGFFDETEMMYKFDGEHREGLVTIGPLAQQRAKWRINNHGWNSPVDYHERKSKGRIAIIGDSYIAALQVDITKSYPALLGHKLADHYDVYQFGHQGAPLSQYLHMNRYVKKTYSPDILIFNVVHNDFHQSIDLYNPNDVYWLRLSIRNGAIEEIPPKPDYSFVQYNPKMKILRNSALVRYLRFNLRVWQTPARVSRQVGTYDANIDLSVLKESRTSVELVVKYILGRIKVENPSTRIVFVMDAPRNDIYKHLENRELMFLHETMNKYCTENGFELLDLREPMRVAYDLNNRPFNSEFDGHWDEYGHEFVSAQILQLLGLQTPNL
jgi:hypothetical protein